MATNILNKLSYGLYILSSQYRDKSSGCIIDACAQVGTNPDQIMISVMNSNYTRKIIEKSGVFCIAVLSKDCPFEMIKHFGFQSSRTVNKFDELTTFTDINGVPSVLSYVCGTISAAVIEHINLGSHTVFIGKVKDQKLLSNAEPMTYAYYQEHVKPKDPRTVVPSNVLSGTCVSSKCKTDKLCVDDCFNDNTEIPQKIIGWQCTICGFIYSDPVLPDDYLCPLCGHPSTDFVPIYE